MYIKDTIAAIATPKGQGGVAIIRISGPEAFEITEKLTTLRVLKPRYAHYVTFRNVLGEVLDEGLLLVFQAPYSFTGENVCEYQVHGSPVIVDVLLEEICKLGARVALPGEFSKRAFLNDKIDLVQAEAVADLIAAGTLAQAKMAQRSLQGEFSNIISMLSNELIQLRLQVEAAIDFPDEEIDFLKESVMLSSFKKISTKINQLLSEVSYGVLMQEGATVAIVGAPNVGKSTLMNTLSSREVSIVTHFPGTTRDVMCETLSLEGLPIRLMDTAGIRDSACPVEQEGIKRAKHAISSADLILLVKDVTQPTFTLEHEWATYIHEKTPVITIMNKADLLDDARPTSNKETIFISAKTGDGILALKTAIIACLNYQPEEGRFMARRRHLEALNETCTWLDSGQQELQETGRLELVAESLRLSHQALCRITGEFSADDLLGEIFSSFCIGK